MASRGGLEDALNGWGGTVGLVAHDGHGVRTVADAIVDVRDGGASWFDGTYEELEWRRGEDARAQARAEEVATLRRREPARRTGRGGRGTRAAEGDEVRALRRELTQVERELGEAEAAVAELTRRLAEPGLYDDRAAADEVVAAHGAAKDRADTLMARWVELGSRVEAAS